jgi:hypothetical protein
MRVLIQTIDRYGERAVVTNLVEVEGALVNGKKVNEKLVANLVSEDETDTLSDWTQSVKASNDGLTVHVSGEETDYVLTNLSLLPEEL